MTNYKQRDIILVDFGFSDKTGSKKRPALVISIANYHKSRHEVIIAAITSNTKRSLFGDTLIENWKEAGLKFPSQVTGIIRTVHSSLIIRQLGTLPKKDFIDAKKNLGKTMEF
ncbi:MAG: type II toxin-antitoxin system PemK/MazF family toxin [Candidatus Ancaeobacter aquaticus]|nr:type II toxin-antitoxin system PemK/MazF family toxin [Candidatus Ancaeobacter aquaticus]